MTRVLPVRTATTTSPKAEDAFLRWKDRTYVMGILNMTPDSFSDGGEYFHPDWAVSRARVCFAIFPVLLFYLC
jgi:hypothetical protein